jgi:hypothetical protein
MCNLYSITTNQAAIISLFRVMNPIRRQPTADAGRVSGLSGVRNGADGRDLAMARWGMPSSQFALMEATKKRAAKLEAKGKPVDFKELLRMEPDGGTTNIRNVKPTAPASPWQNGFAERLIGSIRRECVDHIIVLGEMHLRRVLKSYADYYNSVRTHRSLNKDAPVSRPVQRTGVISSRAILGGLHHHYARV